MAVDDVDGKLQLEDEFEDGPVEEGESLVVIEIFLLGRAVNLVAAEIFRVVDEIDRAESGLALVDARFHFVGAERDVDFRQNELQGERFDLRTAVLGQDEGYRGALPEKGGRKAAGGLGQPPGGGERGRLGSRRSERAADESFSALKIIDLGG